MTLRKLSCIVCAVMLAGCGQQPEPTSPASSTAPSVSHAPVTTAPPPPEASSQNNDPAPSESASPDAMDLAKRSGCFACHDIERKVVGPAWRDVATRYRGDPEARARLIKKVHEGGKGSWSEVTGGVTMPAYSPRVASADIEKLVDFVLSLSSPGSPSP